MTQSELIKVGVAAVALVGAGVVIWSRLASDDAGAAPVYFYDVSEKQLYAVPKDSVPPLAGLGGAADDGVRAYVIACKGDCGDVSKRKIAYLETYTPELRKLQSEINAALKAGTPPPPGESRDFYSSNTLVRLVDAEKWYPISSPEGLEITRAWMNDLCADGKQKVVCTP